MTTPDLTTSEGRLAAADPDVRRREALRLAEAKDHAHLAALRTRVAAEDNPEVTAALLLALAACHPAEAVGLCAGRLWDTNPTVRVAAVDALAGLGGEANLKGLKALLTDDSPRVRVAAAAALINGGLLDGTAHLNGLLVAGSSAAMSEAVNVLSRLHAPGDLAFVLPAVAAATHDTPLRDLVRVTEIRLLDSGRLTEPVLHAPPPPGPSTPMGPRPARVLSWALAAMVLTLTLGWRLSSRASRVEPIEGVALPAPVAAALAPRPEGALPLARLVPAALTRGDLEAAAAALIANPAAAGAPALGALVVEAAERVSPDLARTTLDRLARAGLRSDVLRARGQILGTKLTATGP